MNHNEIFNAAKNNNIRKLLQAKKEIRQVHNARNLTETMYLNDIAEVEQVMCQAEQMIESMLEDVSDNTVVRSKAWFLLGRDYIFYADALNSGSMSVEKSGWRKMMYCALCERYFDMESVKIEDLYDRAKMHRIRTIVLESGMENLFSRMSMEAKRIRLDTTNIRFLCDMLLEIECSENERMEAIKKIVAECLRNRLWVDEGAINQRYFERVREINNVIHQYYKKEARE